MAKFRMGIQLHPQQTTYASIAEAARRADQMGVDSIWVWDHFFPLYGDPGGNHFEAYTLLAPWQPRPARQSWASWSPATATAIPIYWPI